MLEKPQIPTRYTETLRLTGPEAQFDAFTKLQQWQRNGQMVLRDLGVTAEFALDVDTTQQPPLHSVTVTLQPHPFAGSEKSCMDHTHFDQVLKWAQKPICAQETVPGILPPKN